MSDPKNEAKRLWNRNPCGGGIAGVDYASVDFFRKVEHQRYEVSDTWIPKTIDFHLAKGKKLLEIGFGIGTDLLEFCKAGAEVYGIDITEEHLRLAARNFELHGKNATLRLCDCAAIDFPDNFFDVVYSLGVLHHTPDTVRCISEAHRVLKPGGQLIIGLYYTYSAYHLINMVLYQGLMCGRIWKLGYRGLMSTVESGADGIDCRPLVKTYGKRKLKYILEDFKKVDFKIAHFKRDHIPFFGRLVPIRSEEAIGSVLGWYLIGFATK